MTDPKSGNAFDSKQNGLRGSTYKQHTFNLVPRAFSMAWEWTKVEYTVIYVLGQYSKRYRASFMLQVNVKNIGKRGHIVADTLLPTQMFRRLPARGTFVAAGHKKCF